MSAKESPFQSRKLIAYLVGDVCWTLLIGGGLYRTEQIALASDNHAAAVSMITLLMAMVIVKGFVQTGFLLGQSYVDRYTQVAEILYRGGKPIEPPSVGALPSAGAPPSAGDPPTAG